MKLAIESRLFWKLSLIIAAGTVALFYAINVLTNRAEEGMSFLAKADQQTLINYGRKAEHLYKAGDYQALEQWLDEIRQSENTWVSVVKSEYSVIAGDKLNDRFKEGNNLGRGIDWKIHLYFADNPIMEYPFAEENRHFLILLPQHMRPGLYWGYTSVALQIVLPIILLSIVSWVLYRHIMTPLRTLERVTREFSRGSFELRAAELLAPRNDELTQLARTFDQMAARIGDLITAQRQLISDFSHELRTPLTRLDMAVASLADDADNDAALARIERESSQIRKLVQDTLALAWLENERPQLQQEQLDLVDLLDILIDDARYEFPARELVAELPENAPLDASNHRALGQALENIIRNAMRYTPANKRVSIELQLTLARYVLVIMDQGPGVPEQYLQDIFQPFFRVDNARPAGAESFGLGLALAKRQIEAVGGEVRAYNLQPNGLAVEIALPR